MIKNFLFIPYQNTNAIRQADPQTYGVKGAKKGSVGWVQDGWKRAVIDSSAEYRLASGTVQRPRKPKRQYTDEQKRYRKGYLHELRAVKASYAPYVPGVSAKKDKPKNPLKPKIEPVYLYKNPGFASFNVPPAPTGLLPVKSFQQKRQRDAFLPNDEFESY